MKPATYAEWHEIPQSEIPAPYTAFLQTYKKQGNFTKPCSEPLPKEEVLRLAWLGEQAAITWCKFTHWLPLDFSPESDSVRAPQEPRRVGDVDLREARRRHAIALCCSGLGIYAAKQVSWMYCVSVLRFVPPFLFFPAPRKEIVLS